MVLQEAVHVRGGVGNKVGDKEGHEVGLDVVEQWVLGVNRPEGLSLMEGDECVGGDNFVVGVVVKSVERTELEGSFCLSDSRSGEKKSSEVIDSHQDLARREFAISHFGKISRNGQTGGDDEGDIVVFGGLGKQVGSGVGN